jgi:hypothetical protein
MTGPTIALLRDSHDCHDGQLPRTGARHVAALPQRRLCLTVCPPPSGVVAGCDCFGLRAWRKMMMMMMMRQRWRWLWLLTSERTERQQ